MSRSVAAIAADLDRLDAGDFDLRNPQADGMERLYELTGELVQAGSEAEVAALLFRFIERLSQSDAIDPRYDLGTPGPLVFALESLADYQAGLIASVRRQPTPLTVWMINRILNATQEPARRQAWLELLEECLVHPAASPATVEDARSLLAYQRRGAEPTP